MTEPLSQRTLTFLVQKDHVLLGYKKTGFGKGYFVGIGGKVENEETIEQAAVREVQEEIDVEIKTVEKRGEILFLFPHRLSWNQSVHIFIANTWKGDPKETNEIRPAWFPIDNIPFSTMWDDARHWLPTVLNGKHVNGTITFSPDLVASTITIE